MKFKVGDVVRYGGRKNGLPIYDFNLPPHTFDRFEEAVVTDVSDESFQTQQKGGGKWLWPAKMPAKLDPAYWPQLKHSSVAADLAVNPFVSLPTRIFKVGDIVRYGALADDTPKYSAGHDRGPFAKYRTAKVTHVDDGKIWTTQERLANSDIAWVWSEQMPSHHDATYWLHLASDADRIDLHEYMHTFLGPQSVEDMKVVELAPPKILPLTADLSRRSHPPAKETPMSKHILALAANRSSSVPGTNLMSGRLQDALKVAMEKQAKETAEAAAAEILSMIRTLEVSKESERASIKGAQARINASNKKMAALDRAMEYAGETENFIPLMQLLGIYIDANFFSENPEVVRTVPEGWIPAAGPPSPAVKKSKKT